MRRSSPSVRGLDRSPGARIWSSEPGTARRHSPADLVAIDRIDELGGVELDSAGVRVGALMSHAELMTDPVIVGSYTAIADASALVGSPSTRHVGTLGGNVMNGSPAMDTGAPLTVLGAAAELRSVNGSRTVALDELWAGPGRTTADPGELLVALHLPPAQDRCGSAYVRLEYRRAMEIAVVGAAAAVTLAADGTVASAASRARRSGPDDSLGRWRRRGVGRLRSGRRRPGGRSARLRTGRADQRPTGE